MSSSELTSSTSQDIAVESLRLLSVNKVRQILKTRHETVKKLVQTGRIKAVKINKGKYKIPYKSLLDYVNGDSTPPVEQDGIISLEETQSKIDALIEEYKN